MRQVRIIFAVVLLMMWSSATSVLLCADERTTVSPDGFTEPYQIIQVAIADSGVIDAILVEKGERVSAGQTLARLDTNVLQASLAVANVRAKSTSAIAEAKALWTHEWRRAKMLDDLLKQGHANEEEVHLARTKEQAAAARVIAAERQLQIYRLEQEQIKAQIRARQLFSPVTGVITDVHRQPGEFVSASDPAIVTLVRLDLLRVKFFVPADRAFQLWDGQRVQVLFTDFQKEDSAVIDFISPLVDASSTTVQVEVVIDNTDNAHRSGQRCQLKVASATRPAARVSQNRAVISKTSRYRKSP